VWQRIRSEQACCCHGPTKGDQHRQLAAALPR
jgi:hypothetical protein